MSESINFKYGSHIRSLSEQRFVSSKTRLNSIPNKSNNRKDMANGSDKQLLISEKPLILPPIVNPNTINRSKNQSQTNKNHMNFVPNFTKSKK